MSRNNWQSDSDFEMIYDDWMVSEKEEYDFVVLAETLARYVNKKYPENISDEIDEKYDHLYDKALALQQKLAMAQYAVKKYYDSKKDFESTQNMDIPCLYGQAKTRILFYLESIIVFGRNALDVSSNIYSDILLDSKIDSFNKLCKRIDKLDDSFFDEFKERLSAWREADISAFNLMCGEEKGRALRDTIIHQANVRINYYEYKENSEKEALFIDLKDHKPIDLDWFIESFIDGLYEIINECNALCYKKINL